MFKVEGKRFFPIGGQLHNSSSNNIDDMEKGFKAVKAINGNSIAAPIMWELFEVEENKFDFTQLHNMVDLAKKYQLKLIVLWFGSWKNGMSHYIPSWIKKDRKRFEFVLTSTKREIRNLSCIGKENLKSDINAFRQLMKEIKNINEENEIIIAVQVENESGIIGSDRDYSQNAQNLFSQNVPNDLIDALCKVKNGKAYEDFIANGEKRNSNWQETFGYYSGEYFTAYHTSKYVEKVASSGKEIFDIPMYTNCWLKDMYIKEPGASYPSGGPTINVLEIWKAFTPSLFTIAPDIYVSNFQNYKKICKEYKGANNELYIPESSPNLPNSLEMFSAICDYNAIGFHCFAVDSILKNDGAINEEYCGEFVLSMKILANSLPLIEENKGKLFPIIQEEFTSSEVIDFKEYIGIVKYFKTNPNGEQFDAGVEWLDTFHNVVDKVDLMKLMKRGRGIINYRGNGEFILSGTGYRLILIKKESIENMSSGICSNDWLTTRQSDYLEVSEGNIINGKFEIKRRRNGDETDHGIWVTEDIGLVKVVVG